MAPLVHRFLRMHPGVRIELFLGDETGRTFHVRVSGDRMANDGGVLRTWALDGAGVVLKTACDAEADLQAGRLVPTLEPLTLPSTELHAVHTAGPSPSWRLSAFLDYLEESLSAPTSAPRNGAARTTKGRPSRPDKP